MKFLLLLLLVVVGQFSQTGKPQSQPAGRVSLELGSVTVWLGMTKAEARKQFSDFGYEITDLGDGLLARSNREFHDLRFKNGRLVFADVEWYKSNKEALNAVLGALGGLADKSGSRACSITHQPISRPDMALDRVFIFCGDRSVLIATGKVNGTPTVDVSERIGEIPDTN